jgi:glycosyltransferase involved in cell wall biosynthesis
MVFDQRPRIVIPSQYYLPGYKAGGPIRSISNQVETLGDEFAFFILTADRDFGGKDPYPNITPNCWQTVGKAQVMYLSPEQMRFFYWFRHLREVEYDLIYLNSFFASDTRRTLFLRRLGFSLSRPVILAPRGEFSPGALGLKAFKKQVYIWVALHLGLYDDLTWHSTSELESQDIQSSLGRYVKDLSLRLKFVPNLASPPSPASVLARNNIKQPCTAKIVFLSRIARKKNLDFVLKVLHEVKQAVILDIYGPKEDLTYWRECEQFIQGLPPNIQVTYRGTVTPDQVSPVLTQYHLFFLPTRGENFGHAIIEAWSAGCPVLISDQTPWRDLEDKGIGWDVPLDEPESFKEAIQRVIAMDEAEFTQWSTRARKFATDFVQEQNKTHLVAYRQLFTSLIE